MKDTPTREAVRVRLQGRFGREYTYVASCPSTQRLLEPDAPEGAVAVADEQTEGRGRLGRTWTAPAGTSLLCSLQLRPPAPSLRLETGRIEPRAELLALVLERLERRYDEWISGRGRGRRA